MQVHIGLAWPARSEPASCIPSESESRPRFLQTLCQGLATLAGQNVSGVDVSLAYRHKKQPQISQIGPSHVKSMSECKGFCGPIFDLRVFCRHSARDTPTPDTFMRRRQQRPRDAAGSGDAAIRSVFTSSYCFCCSSRLWGFELLHAYMSLEQCWLTMGSLCFGTWDLRPLI